MKITKILMYNVELPFSSGAYKFSSGSLLKTDATILEIQTDEGLIGWGEATPANNTYVSAFEQGIKAGIRVLAPNLIGKDPRHVAAIYQLMDDHLTGHDYAKSSIDMACWDLLAKSCSLPLYVLFGGRLVEKAPLYYVINTEHPDTMLNHYYALHEKGYRIFQLKIGGALHEDIQRVTTVLEKADQGDKFLLDANQGWRKDQAIFVLRHFQDLPVVMEQPCDNLQDCVALRQQLPLPLKLDEITQDAKVLHKAAHEHLMDFASLKIQNIGGPSKMRKAIDLCAYHGIAMTVEETFGTEIATSCVAHLAVSTPKRYLLNTADLHNYFSVHVAEDGPNVGDGLMWPSDEPGLGVNPNRKVLGNHIAEFY